MVTSKNNKSKHNAFEGFCTLDNGTQTELTDNPTAPDNIEAMVPEGKTRIYFEANTDGKFEILDRIADRDGALISVPVTNDDNRVFEDGLRLICGSASWVNQTPVPKLTATLSSKAAIRTAVICGGILVRSILLDREARKSQFIQATDIFTTSYCTVVDDGVGNLICDDDPQDVSVFNLTFDNYFWQFFNDGTRNIQARFYERESFPTN